MSIYIQPSDKILDNTCKKLSRENLINFSVFHVINIFELTKIFIILVFEIYLNPNNHHIFSLFDNF